MPAKAGIQSVKIVNKISVWIPASAGMTGFFLIVTQAPSKGRRKTGFSDENSSAY
jgi:hypothetical protein